MPRINDRKAALMWAVGWWFTRRYLRRRAAHAVSGVAAKAPSRPSGLRAVVGALTLVGVLAGAFIAWRRFAGGSGDEGPDDVPDESGTSPPSPAEAVEA
jgi:predicted secreted protein